MSDQLQHRLQNFQATPPHNIWSNIEEGLNSADTTLLQQRLSSFEAQPPTHMWDKIDSELYTANEPARKSIKHIGLRYAAAAILLGIVALVTIRFATNDSEKTLAKETHSKPSVVNNNSNQLTEKNASNNTNSTEIVDKAEDKGTNALSEIAVSPTSTKNSSKRYTVVSNEDGQLVRLSKKAYAVFDCAVKSTTQQARCKENIETLQAKMANTMTSPTTDFAGLIDMIKTLEENK